MQQPTKHGLPWTGLYKFPEPVKPEYLAWLKKIWEEEDWGPNYENNRRQKTQGAIYPFTRYVQYNPFTGSKNKELGLVSESIGEHLKSMFPIPMTVIQSELILLTANGFIPWHHDRMTLCSLSTRVIVPFTEHGDTIKYSFTSWREDTPTNMPRFLAAEYRDSDLHVATMSMGNYYAFNFRVPHQTISVSPDIRGTLQLDLIPTELINSHKLIDEKVIAECADLWTTVYAEITEDEKRKLLPLMI